MSRSRNLNQCKSSSLLEVGRHFNIEVEIYYFCQFTFLTLLTKKKKTITNFLNPLNIYRFETPFWVLIHNIQGATSCLVKQGYFIFVSNFL